MDVLGRFSTPFGDVTTDRGMGRHYIFDPNSFFKTRNIDSSGPSATVRHRPDTAVVRHRLQKSMTT